MSMQNTNTDEPAYASPTLSDIARVVKKLPWSHVVLGLRRAAAAVAVGGLRVCRLWWPSHLRVRLP